MISHARFAGPFLSIVLAAAGCSGGGAAKPPAPSGNSVAVAPTAQQQAALAALEQDIATTTSLTGDSLIAARALPFAAQLSYDPMASSNLSLLQASHVMLTTGELALLAKNGFVISADKKYPGFTYGYDAIYADHLPVFVSADSIMHAVHRSYDAILKAVEQDRLTMELGALLDAMRARLAANNDGLGAAARTDADLYLAVAKALIGAAAPTMVAGGDAGMAKRLVDGANGATGVADLDLFGIPVHFDFSQFKPRGHYLGVPALEQYFRAMIWLGRTEVPIIHVDENTGASVFERRQLDLAVALRRSMDDVSLQRWQLIDSVVRAFVGEPDSMTPGQVDQLMADLGVNDPAGLAALPDQTIAQQIVAGGYGKQAINSQVIETGLAGGTLPLSASWFFLGQRYVVDSNVFSNVTFDRVPKREPPRMLPDPLDVAYAALANDQSVALLSADLARHEYAPALEAVRLLVGKYDDSFWHANLYNEWLSALRALSPSAELGQMGSGLPGVARTEPWGRRLLNTQLASWAELRRDTILYAKQSYSGGIACEFPDAYVDPYPGFFAALQSYAAKGAALADTLTAGSSSSVTADVKTYFLHLGDVAAILREMAEHQRTGTPPTAADLAFINEIVKVQQVCGGAFAQGWYPKLFYGTNPTEFDPTIADVHTAPQNESFQEVGNVLHVATGYPRLMVVTIDTCTGPRAYAGLASAYHEEVTTDFQRLNDQDWAAEIKMAPPADVRWMSDLIGQ